MTSLYGGPWANELYRHEDTTAKCRHLKKLTCKGTLRQVFIRGYRLVIQSVMYFQPSFVNCCPSNLFSLVQLSPPPPCSLCQSTLYIQTVYGWEKVWGVLNPGWNNILKEFNTLYLTRFRTYKIARPPPNKTLGGEGASDRKTPSAKSLSRSIF